MILPKLSAWKIILVYIAWWLLLIILEAYAVGSTFGLDVKIAFADSLNINLLIASAGYVVFNSLKYYQPNQKNVMFHITWTLLLTAILSIGCVAIHQWLMATYRFSEDPNYYHYLSESYMIRGVVSFLMISLIAVLSGVWVISQDQQDYAKREEDALRLAREVELTSLRQQLQPHFLFNGLNSISALAGSRPEQARLMIQQLSDFLRGTIKRDDQQLVSLEEEIKHLQLYLDIEKVRFGHRLKTAINRSEDTANLQLPSLLLQPIVENAIKFGLYDTIGEITIRIETSLVDKHLVIVVENPFDPTTSQPKGTGFGLSAVERKLYLLYARNDLLTTRQTNADQPTFTTQVRIPQQV